MSLWTWLGFGDGPNFEGETPNANGPSDYRPGDPDGINFDGEETFSRALPFPVPSPWSGWPEQWSTPSWRQETGFYNLIDTAWAAIDLNASVLAAMPAYRMQSGKIVEPVSWMLNPDPSIYSSWSEFAKQLFWDFQMGEAFILPMSSFADGWPQTMRVIPPWLVNVEMDLGKRRYWFGSQDVTGDILHLRYASSTVQPRGMGPLECVGARMVASELLQRYAQNLCETGGTPQHWISVDAALTKAQADQMLDQWIESRTMRAGYPALLSRGAKLNQTSAMNAKDMALLELAQFNESRIAVVLGVPPFLVGLPSGGDSLTYSNVTSLFDYHDRSSLRPKANAVMSALSNWALPRGQTIELNRDEYNRPGLLERAQAYQILVGIGAMNAAMVQSMERLHGETAAVALSGGLPPPTQQQMAPPPNGSSNGNGQAPAASASKGGTP